MDSKKTDTHYYEELFEKTASQSPETLGSHYNYSWKTDPRRMLFAFSRYKFVGKMFEGFDRVLEVGCGDASATRLVQQTVNKVVVTDFDQTFIEDIESRQQPNWHLDARVHDMVAEPLQENFDGIFSLDVLEHIEKANEDVFLKKHLPVAKRTLFFNNRYTITRVSDICSRSKQIRTCELQIWQRVK